MVAFTHYSLCFLESEQTTVMTTKCVSFSNPTIINYRILWVFDTLHSMCIYYKYFFQLFEESNYSKNKRNKSSSIIFASIVYIKLWSNEKWHQLSNQQEVGFPLSFNMYKWHVFYIYFIMNISFLQHHVKPGIREKKELYQEIMDRDRREDNKIFHHPNQLPTIQ